MPRPNPRRQPAGNNNGGQFAPDTRGATPPSAPAGTRLTPVPEHLLDSNGNLLSPEEMYRAFVEQALASHDEETVTNSRPDAGRAGDAEWSRTYHLKFQNFNARTIEATKELFRARPSQMDPEERKVLFKNWVDTVSDVYGMERPTFHWDTSADHGGGGFYTPLDHSITMSPNHPSVITLVHEFRHALQRKEKGAAMVSRDVERDARAWSLSLYYKVRPNLLKRLVREGRVFHIDPTVFDEE